VEIAGEILAAEGPGALTIKRVAAEFGSSVGTIYRHFDSKEQLVVAVETTELQRIATQAATRADARCARLSIAVASATVRSLARVLDAGAFWIELSEHHLADLGRVQELVGDRALSPEVRADATHELLRPLAEALEEASTLGALSAGHVAGRAALVVAVVPLPASALSLWGDRMGDPDLGSGLLDSLLMGWGADAQELAAAKELLTTLR